MYERFTESARQVMQFANKEAQRFNHEYIGTEHILLGILKEGRGLAAQVLRNLDVDLRKLQLEVEKIVQIGPDMITMGKLPLTPRAKQVVAFAIEEAHQLQCASVGPEHLLLGLLRMEQSVAAEVLRSLKLSPTEVREEVLRLLGRVETATATPAAVATQRDGECRFLLNLPAQTVRALQQLQAVSRRGTLEDTLLAPLQAYLPHGAKIQIVRLAAAEKAKVARGRRTQKSFKKRGKRNR